MAYDRTFKLDGISIANLIHEDGPQITEAPVKGLPDEYTEDGVKHTDIQSRKKTIVVPFNPMTETEFRGLKSLCKTETIFLTTYDDDIAEDYTYHVEAPAVAQNNGGYFVDGVRNYEINPLTFSEL